MPHPHDAELAARKRIAKQFDKAYNALDKLLDQPLRNDLDINDARKVRELKQQVMHMRQQYYNREL